MDVAAQGADPGRDFSRRGADHAAVPGGAVRRVFAAGGGYARAIRGFGAVAAVAAYDAVAQACGGGRKKCGRG